MNSHRACRTKAESDGVHILQELQHAARLNLECCDSERSCKARVEILVVSRERDAVQSPAVTARTLKSPAHLLRVGNDTGHVARTRVRHENAPFLSVVHEYDAGGSEIASAKSLPSGRNHFLLRKHG